MSEKEKEGVSEEKPTVEVPGPRPSDPVPAPLNPEVPKLSMLGGGQAFNGALGCHHKYTLVDKLADVSQVAQELKGVNYVFACEKCLDIKMKGLQFGNNRR